jgi:hypothetical protein
MRLTLLLLMRIIGVMTFSLLALSQVFASEFAPNFQDECNPKVAECNYCELYPDAEVCQEEGGGGGDHHSGGGEEHSSGPGPQWSGMSDGRLNPDPAEYYSIWCSNDVIEVWGGNPSPQLISTIPIVNVLLLAVGGSLDAGAGLTVTHPSEDTVSITGNNGNLAPQPGSKSFSLSACMAQNGDILQLPVEPPPDNTGSAGESVESGVTEDECSQFDFSTDILDCLADKSNLSSTEQLFTWLWQFCVPTVVVMPGTLALFRRGRRTRRVR